MLRVHLNLLRLLIVFIFIFGIESRGILLRCSFPDRWLVSGTMGWVENSVDNHSASYTGDMKAE